MGGNLAFSLPSEPCVKSFQARKGAHPERPPSGRIPSISMEIEARPIARQADRFAIKLRLEVFVTPSSPIRMGNFQENPS